MQHQPVFKLHPVRLPVEPPLVSDRDFLWVELHRKYTAQNMLESKSYTGSLCETHICRTNVSMETTGYTTLKRN